MFTSNTWAECKASCAVMLKHISSWPLATSQGLKSSLCLYFSWPLLSALPLHIQAVSFSLKDLSLRPRPSPRLAFHPLFHVSARCRSISCHGHVITDLFGERRDGWMDFISNKTWGLKRDVNIKIRGRKTGEIFLFFSRINIIALTAHWACVNWMRLNRSLKLWARASRGQTSERTTLNAFSRSQTRETERNTQKEHQKKRERMCQKRREMDFYRQ